METRNKTPGTDVSARPHPGAAPHDDPDRAKNELKQQGEVIRDEARSAGEQIKSSASQAGQQAKQKAGELAEQGKRKAAEYARQAQSQGVAMIDQQKHRAAEQVHTVESAMRRAADKFREDEDDNIAGYIDAAADEVQRLADYLDRREVNSLFHDAQSFGRRRPEWLLGGMFVAGLALTRFLKASADRHDRRRYEGYREYEGYRVQGSTGQGYTGQSYTGASGFAADTTPKLPEPSQSTAQFPGAASTAGTGATTGSSAFPTPGVRTNPASTPSVTNPSASPSSTTPGQPRSTPEVH